MAFHDKKEQHQKPTGGEMGTPPQQERQPQAPGEPGFDAASMDDFEVIRQRQNVMTALARLTDQYRELNREVQRRETLQWMLAR